MKQGILLIYFIVFSLQMDAVVNPTHQVQTFAKNSTWTLEENKGQVTGMDSKKVQFLYKQGTTTAFIMNTGIAYQFEKTTYPEGYREYVQNRRKRHDIDSLELYRKEVKVETYRMDIVFLGANKKCAIIKEGKSRDYIQYYNHDALDVHSYQKITYQNIYPKIDWVVYKNEQGVKYDFVIHPGGNPNDIQLKTKWVEDMNIKPDGSLTMINALGSITENNPVSYQGREEIKTKFGIDNETIHFQLADYNPTQDLVIDPIVTWSTYYGGSGDEYIRGCVTDKLGNIYAVGNSSSNTNIAAGGYQMSIGGDQDAFLVKFNANGKRIWATYYGGSDYDRGLSCDIDSKGNVFIAGHSFSANGIYYNGYQNRTSGGFFAKFTPTGSRVWGSYYYNTTISTIVLDNQDNIILYGRVYGNVTGFAYNAHQTNSGGQNDCFLAKFDSSVNRLFSTYYGGTDDDMDLERGQSCTVDRWNNIYFGGYTQSFNNIAYNGIYNSHSPHRPSGIEMEDAFLVKFNSSGVRQWATYLGNKKPYSDVFASVAVDYQGNVIASGYFYDTSILTIKEYDTVATIVKLDSYGQLIWGRTFFSNWGNIGIKPEHFVTTDSLDNIFCFSYTYIYPLNYQDSFFYPEKSSVYNTRLGLAKFNPQGQRIWGMNYGGEGSDYPYTLSLSHQGDIIIGGYTDTLPYSTKISSNLGKKGHQMSYAGNSDGFLAKICQHTDTPRVAILSNRGDTICKGGQVIFTAKDTFAGDNPIYTWYRNGVIIGSDTNVLVINAIANKDSIRCRLISNASCLAYDTAWSNPLVIKIKIADTTHIYDAVCGNQNYVFNNQLLKTSGLYYDTLVSTKGCDSFIFLHLTVKPYDVTSYNYTTTCSSPSYFFNGVWRTQSGTYKDTLTNRYGCDSIIILNLTVIQPTGYSYAVTRCPSDPYYFHGAFRTLSGTYYDTLTNTQGCDSIVTLNLTILNRPQTPSRIINECPPYTYKTKTYETSTIVIDTFKSVYGCDSAYLTNYIYLKNKPIALPIKNYIVCDSIRIQGKLHTSSFQYTDTTKTIGAVRCDSIYQPISYEIKYRPQVHFPNYKTIDSVFKGETIQLIPTYAKNYLWNTGQTSRNMEHKVTENASFYVIAWNDVDCKDTAYYSIIALDPTIVGFPTAFSPNGVHEQNRLFAPNVNGVFTSYKLDIYNRWGEKVYAAVYPQPIGWDGTFKGVLSPSGIYTYTFEYEYNRIRVFKTGEVLLVR